MSDILRELVDAVDDRRAVSLATVVDAQRSVPRRPGAKMLVYADGSISGTIGGGEMEARVVDESLDALETGRPRRLTYSLLDPATGDPGVCGGEVEVYVEPHLPETTILVVGAGHIGRAVAQLARWVGYRVVVWDDRDELVADVPGAHVHLSGPIADAIADIGPDAHTHVVVVTRNVELDAEILPVLLATEAPYVGLMGSRRRWATTRDALLAAGVAEADLARVGTPIGMEIGAETPHEIAVSILADLVARDRTG